MRKLIGLLAIGLMVSCAQVATRPPEAIQIKGAQVLDGPAVAASLNRLYAGRTTNCGYSNSPPVFLCSGVTIRVTVKDPSYKVWDPSPTSVKSGGVSFSYLRRDSNFGRLAWGYGNGYILYPSFEAPQDKIALRYLCSYPMDAWGWHRSETEVCGPHKDYPVQSQLCQNAGVTTAQEWKDVWNIPGGNPNLRQCGFDVRSQSSGGAFNQSLQAKRLIGATGFNEHNEIIIKTWTPGQPNTFPLMAFFFIAGGGDAGLNDARYNQSDFYNSTNPKIIVPIIRVTPATSSTGSATFTYVAADQAVNP